MFMGCLPFHEEKQRNGLGVGDSTEEAKGLGVEEGSKTG